MYGQISCAGRYVQGERCVLIPGCQSQFNYVTKDIILIAHLNGVTPQFNLLYYVNYTALYR